MLTVNAIERYVGKRSCLFSNKIVFRGPGDLAKTEGEAEPYSKYLLNSWQGLRR
jgi:hypothetical protein